MSKDGFSWIFTQEERLGKPTLLSALDNKVAS